MGWEATGRSASELRVVANNGSHRLMTRVTHPFVVIVAMLVMAMTACADNAVIEAASPVLGGDAGEPAPVSTTTTTTTDGSTATTIVTAIETTTSTIAPDPDPEPLSPIVTTTTTSLPPVPQPFVVDSGEVRANAKQLAGSIAEQLTTYDPQTRPSDIAAAIAPDSESRALLEAAMRPLLHADRWSRGTVVYPQLGGASDTSVSVMVVIQQVIGTGSTTLELQTRTLDIRLDLVDGDWQFAELASAGGSPVPRPDDLSAEASAVLDDPRILLPDSARWDIHRGHTSPALLRLMSDLADVTPFAVTVLATGHPHHVFETERTSKHTVGRAVDVYLVGTQLVIDDRAEGSPTYRALEWLYGLEGVYKLGGPWALDGHGGRSFTDIVHQDHLHISVVD